MLRWRIDISRWAFALRVTFNEPASNDLVDGADAVCAVGLQAGVYQPEKFRDVPYKQYVIRTFVAVERKRIDLIGEPGAILDGSIGPARRRTRRT